MLAVAVVEAPAQRARARARHSERPIAFTSAQ